MQDSKHSGAWSEDKKECYAGQRVAINLSNVKKKEIQERLRTGTAGKYEKY